MNSRLLETIAAVFLGPILAVIVTTTIVSIVVAHLSDKPAGITGGLVCVAIFIGIVGTIIIGLPAHALLVAMGWTRWWSYAIAGGLGGGTLLGAIASAFAALLGAPEAKSCVDELELPAPCEVPIIGIVVLTASFVVVGTLTALFCWLIRRPDLDRTVLPSPQSTIDAQ
jgi:hypothetical protein